MTLTTGLHGEFEFGLLWHGMVINDVSSRREVLPKLRSSAWSRTGKWRWKLCFFGTLSNKSIVYGAIGAYVRFSTQAQTRAHSKEQHSPGHEVDACTPLEEITAAHPQSDGEVCVSSDTLDMMGKTCPLNG